jgi:protein-S-isoprenylcysteine O-methyltransferase Ste14
MPLALRHLLSFAALPFMATVVVPLWLARGNPPAILGTGPLQVPALALSALLALVGLGLFVTSLGRFATDGDGTLAPWDPPRRLVVRGPYRYVRNPMISGVVFILFAEALAIGSRSQLLWALVFLAVNAVYIPLFEEWQLRERFGAAYDDYCRNVPRLLPRRTPWTPAR